MNLGIKDGSHWDRYSSRYVTHPRLHLALYYAIWIATGYYWATAGLPWLSPIFAIWCGLGFLWYVKLTLSRYYFNKRIKQQLREAADIFFADQPKQ